MNTRALHYRFLLVLRCQISDIALSFLIFKALAPRTHSLVLANILDIPQFACVHVSKGDRFIPAGHRKASQFGSANLSSLHRNLLLCKAFPPDTKKRISRCRVPSTWQPPNDEPVDEFTCLVKDNLAEFEPSEMRELAGSEGPIMVETK